ncbi:uncharacterized protein [Miscanthus floridulus]|uniref:uncharacterized protein isoform X3 n=1 Tax=Miscanthus floridulus TaxID=154761 RepID=UPI003459EBBA
MHPTLLFLPLLASLLLLLLHDHASADCEPAACGNLTLRYPFWLGSGTNPPSSSSCGHPGFEVWCSGDGRVASLKGTYIHVLSINYTASSLVASDARVAGDDGVCQTNFNVSSSIALSLFNISPHNRALCFLSDCNNGTAPSGPEYVNTTSNCSTPIYAYLGGAYYWDKPPAPITTWRCDFAYMPVLGSEAAVMTAANYSWLLKDGFVLDWEVAGVGDCRACNASGGQCRYDSSDAAEFWCHCPDGRRARPTCAGSEWSHGKTILIVLMAATASLLFPCIYVLVWHQKGQRLWFRLGRKASSSTERNIEALMESYGSLAPKRYNYSETKESKFSMTGTRGTIGFIAPEVHSRTFGVVSTKSDVYSYGMMLLEMVGGRKNVKSVVEKSSQKYFPDWIYDHFSHDDGLEACEVTCEVQEIAKKMILIGLWCVQVLPMSRPTITKVLEMFERGLDELDMPPKQNFNNIPEESVHILNTETTSFSSLTQTQAFSEVLKFNQISTTNSKNLQRLPTL